MNEFFLCYLAEPTDAQRLQIFRFAVPSDKSMLRSLSMETPNLRGEANLLTDIRGLVSHKVIVRYADREYTLASKKPANLAAAANWVENGILPS